MKVILFFLFILHSANANRCKSGHIVINGTRVEASAFKDCTRKVLGQFVHV